MQVYEVSAFVLHRRPYRETSFLTTFFSASEGKFSAVVKGIKPSRGRGKTSVQKQAWLQPFRPLQVSWQEKSGQHPDLVTLRQFEPASDYSRFLSLSGEANFCGLYMNELLYRLLFPRVAAESLFDAYQSQLSALSDLNGEPKDRPQMNWILRQFEFQLLQELGIPLNVETDLQQRALVAEKNYFYYPELGALETEMTLEGVHSSHLPIEISGECLLALQAWQFCPRCLPAWKKLFRTILSSQLGAKPLMTRQLFRSLS
ncbi:DNA repair protein RecO [Galenea microaerophila]